MLKLIYLQQANQNPFEAFDPEDRPDGADELLVGQPPVEEAEPGMEETPIGPESGAEGEAGLPQDVKDTFNAPEPIAAENASVDYSNDESTVYTENSVEFKKKKLMERKKAVMSKFENQIKEYVESFSKANKDSKKYVAANFAFEEQRIAGEFKGFDKAFIDIEQY